jgi:hypothetical protein
MPKRYADVAWAIVLDPDITEQVIADSVAIAEALDLPESEHLALVINESFRQMRARMQFEDDIPKVWLTSDPVAGLSLLERSHLALNLRMGLTIEEISPLLGITAKRAKRELKSARLHLARTAIALTLLTNPSRCPVMNQFQAALVADISRDQLFRVVSHSAECSICVEVLRVVDKQIVDNYVNAELFTLSTSFDEVLKKCSQEKEKLLKRGDLKNSTVKIRLSSSHPKIYLKRAILFGGISALLVSLATLIAKSQS